MKALFLTLALIFTSHTSFAREPKATLFSDLAQSTVQTMFGKPGDLVELTLIDMQHGGEPMREVWEVNLTNNAANGSATYEVTITQNSGSAEGEVAATVTVRYISGNMRGI